jgi:hypothetical protein
MIDHYTTGLFSQLTNTILPYNIFARHISRAAPRKTATLAPDAGICHTTDSVSLNRRLWSAQRYGDEVTEATEV